MYSNDLLDVSDKHILITGASSGIGKATALMLSRLGAVLTITGRDSNRLAQTFESLCGHGHNMFVSDLSNEISCTELIKLAINTSGPLNGLVHCAGLHKTLPIKSLRESDFDDIFNANVRSSFFLAKAIRSKGNYVPQSTSLIFLSSAAASCGQAAISTYSSSKSALEGMCRSLSVEFSKVGIRVNCIAPGIIETEMVGGLKKQLSEAQYEDIVRSHPLGIGNQNDVSHSVVFLLSSLSTWITGTVLHVDGGYTAK
ncbi:MULTISPECIES: SDR family NAD(P)-dependent oxidoreductase [unclassified Shewanella]|uniref:SDR family NAD(P)-dependent oxidoreductase n=1 Tax=unclassified Shewanella TaxID=196818 RepID=UPI0039B493F9